jgi:hypothetical protein
VSAAKRVIIPRFPGSNVTKYFVPRFVKIMKGDVVEWLNTDTKPHHLVFSNRPDLSKKTIQPNHRLSIQFSIEFTGKRLDYKCAFHPLEQGTIIIYQKDENQMTNTERIRFLSEVFNIQPPDFLSHQGSKRNE